MSIFGKSKKLYVQTDVYSGDRIAYSEQTEVSSFSFSHTDKYPTVTDLKQSEQDFDHVITRSDSQLFLGDVSYVTDDGNFCLGQFHNLSIPVSEMALDNNLPVKIVRKFFYQ